VSTPKDFQLRKATVEDAEALASLINEAFRSERFFNDEDRINPGGVRDYLKKGTFILAEAASDLAGCVYLESRDGRFYLGLLSVAPPRQHAGLGSFLMKVAEEHCRAHGARGIDLQIVDVRKELPGYYHRFGYSETGTAPFPEGVKTKIPCHFVIMSKELK
jgi:N-acetylglutamate synthase-like GNAT family acetyltransferase